jgi:hypothetical protein
MKDIPLGALILCGGNSAFFAERLLNFAKMVKGGHFVSSRLLQDPQEDLHERV